MHRPEMFEALAGGNTESGTSATRLSPAIVDELRTALLPVAAHPYGAPRQAWLDNLVKKIQQGGSNAPKPHVHTIAILFARQDRGESLDQVLQFPSMLMGLLTARAAGPSTRSLDELQCAETEAEATLNRAQWRYQIERSDAALADLFVKLCTYQIVHAEFLAAVSAKRAA